MKPRGHRGFSMIELVVVLAVIAILATLITPIITSYIDRAKVNKAQSDVRNISAALVQFSTDAAVYPIFINTSRGVNAQVYEVLSSFGEDASQDQGITGWLTILSTNLDMVLNQNSLGFPTQGSIRWNGPYIDRIGEDPWGKKYYVTGISLNPSLRPPLASFVLSAGPNQLIETQLRQERARAFQVGGDDIVQRIR